MPSLSTFLAILLFVAVVAALLSLIRRHREKAVSRAARHEHRMVRIEHLLRLATEIAAVSRTIERDLTPFRSLPALEALQSQARRMRLQVEATLATRDRLLDLPWFELEAKGANMHAGHFRMVALRATADTEIRDWRKHVRRGLEGEKSTWPFMSTPMSSGFDG